MAKGIGLIGNFKGKVGNMVGYKLSDSNTGNSQGIRVYQPIVRNPKTSAQAEQRAKLAPINATYRALKMVIDRGNEGLPYGNKSRLAWLKVAFKATVMPWYQKGVVVSNPICCQLTKGSLPSFLESDITEAGVKLPVTLAEQADPYTVKQVSEALLAEYSFLKEGDQITFVAINSGAAVIDTMVLSFVIDTTSTTPISMAFDANTTSFGISAPDQFSAGAIILSREGANGEHLRSNSMLEKTSAYPPALLQDEAKVAAIESYQNAAGANSDWAEESIQ